MLPLTQANPLAGNPLRSRDDLQQAVRDLVAPLLPHFSPGAARVSLSSLAAGFPQVDAEFEGFARPLWGLVPLAAGGGDFDAWEPWVRGLKHGPDPSHPEHWHMYEGTAQTMVEQAVVGVALALVPEIVWEPLDEAERDRLADWLGRINQYEPVPNNWQFFRVLVNLGLENVGRPIDDAAQQASLDRIDTYYLDDGWYGDGVGSNRDHYIGWAIHAYGLIYARLRPEDPRSDRYRERARRFAADFAWWFDDEGRTLPFGRSLTYRFAAATFWSALVFADVEALPWGEVKGLLLRHLRWWSTQAIADRDGVLNIGWSYAQPDMREEYNSAGSPYWAMKAFLCLAQPADHPFWSAEELPLPGGQGPQPLRHAGMLVSRDGDQTIALSGGHAALSFFNQGAAKYARFAYSSRFALGIDPTRGTGESSLAFTAPDSGQRFTRQGVERWSVGPDAVYTRWSPCEGVRVDTLLTGNAPWHVRWHRIETRQRLKTTETGFALGVDTPGGADTDIQGARAFATSQHGASCIIDLDELRAASVGLEPSNTNLAHPFSVLPALRGVLEPGITDLRCAVGASIDGDAVRPDRAPELAADVVAWFEARVAEA